MIPVLRARPRNVWPSPFDAFRRDFGPALEPWPEDQAEKALAGVYPVDVREDDDHLYVEAEMPGFTKDEIEVNLDAGVLTIRAEREPGEFSGTRHLEERRFTRIQRSFTLPTYVDESSVDAEFKDGLLTVTLDKQGEAKRRKIEVK